MIKGKGPKMRIDDKGAFSEVPEPREAVARAICKAHGNEPDAIFGGLMGNSSMPAWMLYLKQADAAIAALKEPSHG